MATAVTAVATLATEPGRDRSMAMPATRGVGHAHRMATVANTAANTVAATRFMAAALLVAVRGRNGATVAVTLAAYAQAGVAGH